MIRIALVELPPLLGEVLARALAASPDIRILPGATAAEFPSLAAGRQADAVVGCWPPAETAAAVRSLRHTHPDLVVVAVLPGPPTAFEVHSGSGCTRLPADASAHQLIQEIRRAAPAPPAG